MTRTRGFVLNAALLTATSMLMRTIGMGFQVFLSNRIGAAGLGLFQLVASVSLLASTVAVSGIRFAATRLVSEELAKGGDGAIRGAVRRCCVWAISFGCAVCLALTLSAGWIGTRLIGDGRTVLSLRILALSLPFLGISGVFSGYFTAVCRVLNSSAAAVAEQLVRIAAVVLALGLVPEGDLEHACAAVVLGGVAGECASFLLLFALYRRDAARHGVSDCPDATLTRRLIAIALPLAFSSYARTALNTLQHLLVPKALQKSGRSAAQALADYGSISGMALPLVTFPSALFYALADLMVPELTQAQVNAQPETVRRVVNRTLRRCLLFALGVSACLFVYARPLGEALYRGTEVDSAVRVLACLCPVMYMDSVTDGILRGLGQQMYCMYVNIPASVLSVLLVWLALPRLAVAGYLFMICFTEVFNCALSMGRLRKLTPVRLAPDVLLRGVVCAAASVTAVPLGLRLAGLDPARSVPALALALTLSLGSYAGLLRLTGRGRKRLD